jgi:hypothetical protein
MQNSRPLEWIEQAEARKMLTIAQCEAKPQPFPAQSAEHTPGWLLRQLRLLGIRGAQSDCRGSC